MTYKPYQKNYIIYNTRSLEWVDGFEHRGPADIGLKFRTDKGEQDLAVTSIDRLMQMRRDSEVREPECYADCEDRWCPYTH